MSAQPPTTAMDSFGLTFHHLGLATRSPEKSVAFLQSLGYRIGETIHDPIQNVNLIMCPSARMPAVEVIFPAAEPGPLAAILVDRNEGFYHFCFQSRDLAASLAAMKQAGHRVIEAAAPQPAVLFDNKRVSFYMVKGFGLIKILED
jgi:methylmalonyl-CoA/ethylmalonyl-CoA epimerase